MYDDKENPMECTGSTQLEIIKPYMSKIRNKISKTGISEEMGNYFIGQLISCLAMLAEHEAHPIWIRDLKNYRMKSEIVAFLSLFSSLGINEEPNDEEKRQISNLYENVCAIGAKRGWDLQILYLQFIRMTGVQPYNPLTSFSRPRVLELLDYN